MGSEYPPAKDMYVDTNRTFVGANPRGAIVIHKTAGFSRPEDCANFFATDPNETSSHFIIGLDGSVIQCVSLGNGAAANCCLVGSYDGYWDQYNGVNLNKVTISIEHIDDHKDAFGEYDNQGVVPEAQMQASIDLCMWLKLHYDMQPEDVKTHASIDPVDRSRCPGNYDMERLIGAMSMSTPVNKVPSPNQDKAFHVQWNAANLNIKPDTGIYSAWVQQKLNGKNYNGARSPERASVNWSGNPIIIQEGGNWWAEYTNGTTTFYNL